MSLTETFDIELPLFAFSHCRDVVAAGSRNGGFGVLRAVELTPEELRVELDWITAHTNGRPFGLDLIVPNKVEERSVTDVMMELRTKYLEAFQRVEGLLDGVAK